MSNTRESSDTAHHASSQPPSAVAIFSNIISPVKSQRVSLESGNPAAAPVVRTPSKPKTSFAGPDDLPTEILLLVFRFVFEACVNWHKTSTLSSEHATVWLEENPLSPSLFPYSLASVCVRWLHILSSIPAYWTRQVIAVDSQRTSLTTVQTLLRWVGNLSLQLIVTGSPGPTGQTDRDEHARVRDVLVLLRPHIRHTWSLTFDVKYSSSVPAIWREKGDAQCLRVLTLMSSRSDTGSTADLSRLPELSPMRRRIRDDGPLRAHMLEEVTLGGHFFNDALSIGKQRNHWFCNITSLTIRGYAAFDGGGISLYGFVSTVQTCALLERLTVEDVAFVNDVHASYRFRLEAPIVRLRKVTDDGAFGTLISQSLGTRLKEVVSVTECPFDNFGIRNLFRTSLPSINLLLDSMEASCAAIERLVCFWNGENLTLINCPGVTDLFMRGVPADQTPPRLRCLQIVDCDNATAGGLITMVRSREIQSEIDAIIPGDLDAEPCQALTKLQVYGRGPPIGHKQAFWLAEHLESFSWYTVASDGMQYAWSNLTRELVVAPQK